MSNGETAKQTRAIISVALINVPDDKAVGIKKEIDKLVDSYPDAAVDLRIGTGRVPTVPTVRTS